MRKQCESSKNETNLSSMPYLLKLLILNESSVDTYTPAKHICQWIESTWTNCKNRRKELTLILSIRNPMLLCGT